MEPTYNLSTMATTGITDELKNALDAISRGTYHYYMVLDFTSMQIHYISDDLCKIFGISQEQANGMSYPDFLARFVAKSDIDNLCTVFTSATNFIRQQGLPLDKSLLSIDFCISTTAEKES